MCTDLFRFTCEYLSPRFISHFDFFFGVVVSKQFNFYAKGSSDSSSSSCLFLNPTTESVKDVIEHDALICSQPLNQIGRSHVFSTGNKLSIGKLEESSTSVRTTA